MENATKIDLIWNITSICSWDCKICCVDASNVSKSGNSIRIASNGLNRITHIPILSSENNIYTQAYRSLRDSGIELTFEEKKQVIQNIKKYNPKIDFSGGDPLLVSENLKIIQLASTQFGKKQITLTSTCAGVSKIDIDLISSLIGEFNFTYDSIATITGAGRPVGYSEGNLNVAKKLAINGVATRAECPISTQNINMLKQIYLNLHEASIEKLLLMRLFPVGRGIHQTSEILSRNQYVRSIELLKSLERKYSYPKIIMQCALKYLYNTKVNQNPCNMIKESYGIMSNGTLLASPWAIGKHGQPLHNGWVLGDISETPLEILLESKKVQAYKKRLNDNFGHCKVFSYIYSEKSDFTERIFDQSDPLFEFE